MWYRTVVVHKILPFHTFRKHGALQWRLLTWEGTPRPNFWGGEVPPPTPAAALTHLCVIRVVSHSHRSGRPRRFAAFLKGGWLTAPLWGRVRKWGSGEYWKSGPCPRAGREEGVQEREKGLEMDGWSLWARTTSEYENTSTPTLCQGFNSTLFGSLLWQRSTAESGVVGSAWMLDVRSVGKP